MVTRVWNLSDQEVHLEQVVSKDVWYNQFIHHPLITNLST
jgi:hypothetical protein